MVSSTQCSDDTGVRITNLFMYDPLDLRFCTPIVFILFKNHALCRLKLYNSVHTGIVCCLDALISIFFCGIMNEQLWG